MVMKVLSFTYCVHVMLNLNYDDDNDDDDDDDADELRRMSGSSTRLNTVLKNISCVTPSIITVPFVPPERRLLKNISRVLHQCID